MTPEALSPLDTLDDTAPLPGVGVPPVWPGSNDIELRVLQGPQAGCRLAMGPRQVYTLGTADESSVVLVGQHVQPVHAQVHVQADMVEITPLDGPVWIGGAELPPEGDQWELGTVFLVGRVALCVDEVGMPWPTEEVIAASAALALQGSADADGSEPDITDDLDDLDQDTDSLLDGEGLPEEEETHPADRAGQRIAATDARTSRLQESTARPDRVLPWLSAVGGAALLGAVASAAWLGWSAPPMPGAALPVTLVIADPATGATESPPATAALPTPEQVAARMDALVQQLNDPGRVSARWQMADGSPAIRIATADAADSAGLLARVEAMRPQTGPVAVTLVEPADMAARFRESLQAGNLLRKFTADPADPRQLSYKASLTLEDIPVWERLFLSFTETHGNTPPVTVMVNTDLDRLGSRIGSVVGGAFPYIVTPEGHRIAPGGSLMGRTVASVQIGEIVFVDGVRYRFIP